MFVLGIFLIVLFVNLKCEVYQDRPKIKTSDGDLILEPAFDKNIYLRPNGPKSSIFVGEVNILSTKSKSDIVQSASNSDIKESLNGLSDILQRLQKLESKSLTIPDDLFLNISTLWRKVNNLHRKVHILQVQANFHDVDACQTHNPCQHGGTCLNLVNGYHCLCPTNWEGKDCDVDVNECRNFAGTELGCQNGATCINKPGYYECLCRSGWFGLHCTRKAKDCSGGDFEMCGHGTCLSDSTRPGITCLCHQGWTTNGTDVSCLTDVNECESYQGARCSVNPKVECINLPGSFRCGQCPSGYEGDGYSCADIDECTTIPNGGCSPLVACHNTVGSRICGPCPHGYEGDGVTCSWRGSCNVNHGGCHPSAQCIENVSLGRIAQCICPDGMEGDGVGVQGCYISSGNTDSCANNPCVHGQCHMLRSGYTCICQRGYSGPHCDIPSNLCSTNPCRNGGICRLDDSSTKGFRCECTAQYSGSLCQTLSRTCGGVLNAEEGSIVYPLSNTTYVHNSRCAWVIHTVPNKIINVTFSKFSLEDHHECAYDFLQIHDGRSSAKHLIGRFCGNTFPKGGNILSSHNYLYFWFRSDDTVAKPGFALHWTSVDPICGGEIDANTHGLISSPGSPGPYPPNRDCYWHLTTAYGKNLQLHFFTLDIENHPNCSFDYLAIYDGMRNTDPLLNKYCNSSNPAPLQSAGSEILIHFHSDAYGSGNGFQLSYAPVAGIPGCGGYFTAEKGEIISPSYNGSYLNDMLCEYKIKTSPDTKVQIDFLQFNLEKSHRCKFDFLKIYDGPSAESKLVGRFCGTTHPKSYVSSSNQLFIIFRSDLTISSQGFKLLYKTICKLTFHGDSGVIKSPGYPITYPENRVCEYLISTTPGKAIQLTFQDFDIEDNNYYNCQYDHVEIRDGADANATLIGKYCGGSEHIPPTLLSTHNYMYLRFNSDMSITGTGFYANYTTIATECGGIHRERTGLINHPSDDSSSYKNEQSCTWILIAPEGMHIKLTWNRFDIEKMPSCQSDYLELIEIDDNNENNNIGKFCGNKAPPALTTSTNRLMIKFESDNSVRSSGFSASYTFLDEKSHCGGTFYRSHGFIYSPGWPHRYEQNRDCIWIITVPVGQQVRLNISQFDLERPILNGCQHGDYLEVRNGATQNSALIGSFCGKFKTKILHSFVNTIYIHFHSDYYITGNGFQIEWDGSVYGCGGTLTSSSGSISSPNYPESYNENTECFYKIVTNQGSRIRITFTDMELERTRDCRDDYIEIFDGRDSEASSLGRHCSMSAGLNNVETTSNYAFIKFRSDAYIGGKGFLLNYFTICNNNLTGMYGVIESPDYPNYYPLRLNCLWNINVPKGNKINVTFNSFDIYKNVRYISPWRQRMTRLNTQLACDQDYLQWKEASETKYSDKLCGTTLPPMISTKSNTLQIKFSSGMYPRPGFRLEWVNYGCGGRIRKSAGTVSIDKDSVSSEELECEWLIESPLGTSIYLVITDIYISETHNCTVDAIEVYNGQNINSPLLTKFCSRHKATVQSTSNYIFIKFIKHSSLKGAYFLSSFNSRKATCGGLTDSLSGFIHSKNYPKNYDDNMDCSWVISVPVYHRIELNFTDLDLYSTDYVASNDCGDSIKIYDNYQYYSNMNYTSIICPRSNIKHLITKSNRIMLQFTSDSYGNAKGFKAYFSVYCGAYITALNDGIISNENYIGGPNNSCTWTIRAAQPDQKISLTITHISLPKFTAGMNSNRSCGISYLRVFDGDDTSAPLIDEYCGKKAPPMIVSRGSAITVSLGSYNDKIVGIFSAHYSSLNEACGGTLVSEEGSIASPNYPRSYLPGTNCEWILSTSPGNKVYIVFEQFDIEYSENCNEDYLEIREDNGIGKLLGVYCGSTIPLNTTTASKLYVKFHSSAENNGKGFLLHYGFLHGNDLINMEKGEIASPLYPHLYQGSAMYSWRIQSNGPEDIVISVDNLEISSYGNVCHNTLSIFDGYDDTAPLLSTLCGKLSSNIKVLETSSNVAYIKLSLDDSNTGALFHLKWGKKDITTIDADVEEKINCGNNHTELISAGNSSTIKSPNFPKEYENDLNCEWIFQATRGRHLQIRFQEFKLEETNRCFADYVNIYSSDTLKEWKTITENICEEDQGQRINSSRYMKIQFKTDSSITKKGFIGKVSSVCGGFITDLSGEVGLDWNDVHMTSHSPFYKLKCEWTVKVRPGRLIELKFVHFNISNRDDDCSVSVTLRNGDSIEAPFLSNGKYCGYSHEKREKLTTSSNSLHIIYNSDFARYSTSFQNFKLRYEEKSIECGASSNLDVDQKSEVISSPNYPNPSYPFSECIWVFTGPPGEILRIDFIDRFDLDNIDNCDTEVVEIRDGTSNLAPLLERACGEKPSTIKSTNNALYIRYLTRLSEPRNGFKANVSIDICGGTIVAGSGEIKSPGYPNMNIIPFYGTNCEWHIRGPRRVVFNIKPLDIDVPESETPCDTKVTIEEMITSNNSKVILKTFCNEDDHDRETIETSTNEFVIRFSLGKPSVWSQGIQKRGFRFSFTSSRPVCGGEVTTPEGYIATPGYPQFTPLRYCQWSIKVPDTTRRVRLELIDADAGKHTIGIYNDDTFQSLIETITGDINAPITRVYESSGNKISLFLWLHTRASTHRFKAKFSSDESALCGGELHGIKGNLSSPDLQRAYTCKWHYNIKDNIYNTILVTARVNSSITRNRCRFSDPKLNVRSTVTKRGLTFYRDFCGTTESTYRIPSSVMDLTATRSKSNSLYFYLEWKSQPCGGTINVGIDPVNILENISNVTDDVLDCAWLISMPYNTKLELKMEGAFQYNCDDEFINIGQGVSQTAPTIGSYCKGKILDEPLITNFMYMYIQYHSKNSNSSGIKLMARSLTSQCGGQLAHYQYTFESPNFPKSYEPNQECSWIITAELGSRISLMFIDRLVIEETTNCTKDALIIYDWKNDAYREIARICGRQLPQPYNSTYNKMKVIFRTDATTNMDGFKAKWIPICGGNYVATSKEQFLYSPGFPFGYPQLADCTYTISSSNNQKLLVQFKEFELEGIYPECINDNVTLSGENNYEYLYEVYCGNKVPSTISNYDKITIKFLSDRYVQRKGFKISYQIYDCGGKVKEPTLLSSHHGDSYDANMNCTWLIEAPTDRIIVFKFLYIDLESHYSCNNDYLAVYDDLLINDDKRLALMCGHVNSTTVLRSHGNKALIQFVSDQSYNFKGFKVEVSFTYSESIGCGGHIDLTSSPKTLKSFLLGNNITYEKYLDCHWTITSPSDTFIKIEFTSFHVSPCEHVTNQTAIGSSKCDCDFVEIKDGLNPNSIVIGTFCGHTKPPILSSSGNFMSVRLSTDGDTETSSGFVAQLTAQRSECGKSLFKLGNTVAHIKSPGFEKGVIPRGIHCLYYIDASDHPDAPVRLSILDLDLRSSEDVTGTKKCNYDKLIITNHIASRNVSIGKENIMNYITDSFIYNNYYYYEDEYNLPQKIEFCGSTKPSDIYITGSISITLITSSESDSINHRGVDMEVAFGRSCGRNYTGTQGKIETIYRNPYGDDPNDCYTLITAPENHTISAYFIVIVPDYWNDAVYLDIYDGKDTSSKKLVSINTDYDTTMPVFSTSRYMLLHNHHNNEDHVYYNMNYVTTDKGPGCGGKLSNALGRVTSPNYPNVYRKKSACEWELETPVGTRLMLHFEVFELGRVCDQNYLQLMNSKGEIISTYCSETPADYTSNDNFVKIIFYTTMNNGGSGWVADFVGRN